MEAMMVTRRRSLIAAAFLTLMPSQGLSRSNNRDVDIYVGTLATWHDLASKRIRLTVEILGSAEDDEVVAGIRAAEAVLMGLVMDMAEFKTQTLGDFHDSHLSLAAAIIDASLAFSAHLRWRLDGQDGDHQIEEDLVISSTQHFKDFYDSLPINLPDRSAVRL